MSLIRRGASVLFARGKFYATPILRGQTANQDKESSEEEKYAAKHDYELLMKWAAQQGKKMEVKTEEVKKEVREEIAKHNKQNVDEITQLKEQVAELKSMLSKALEKK
ncbi:hypothetical protein C9374_004963 [Naegleria lovaniensis]|uniref:Mitochondrial ATPase inhibitor n=1 Tax=Naegleria lovaniensis TaxID=51637 RepID=A0AA88GL59_NAELO|nr:uncharacterized protein C9374_004963 [Naegleria lovaniensis]KAG2382996.1 hypothetical protein C9374_004963 [Naegleria lovaniensis]